MTSNDDVELPWETVAKSRRSKKPVVRVATSGTSAGEKSSKGRVGGQSKPEKLGVSVLGQHLAEKVKHVPIKKRTFMVASSSSAQREGSEHKALTNLDDVPVSRLNTNLVSDVVRDENLDCSAHDFSGVKLLADTACRFHVSNDHAPAVDRLPATEVSVVQQQDAPTLSTHVEGNDSSARIVDVSHTAVDDSSDPARQGESDNVASQKSPLRNLCNDLGDDQSVGHSRVTYGGMIARPKANVEASENEALAPDNGVVTVSEKPQADMQGPKQVRLHWDLNLPIDAWDQPYDVEYVASGRDVEGEITESSASKKIEPVNGSKDLMDGVISSDGHANFSSSSVPKVEAVAIGGKECESGYDSEFEDGELREPYPWVDKEEAEQLDYGFEREDEKFHSKVESNDLADNNFTHVNMSDSHPKKGSSSHSRSFGSKPFRELPSHDAIQRRRPDNDKELSTGPDRFLGRDDRSGMRMRNRSPRRGYIIGWDSKRRFSSPNYKGSSYGFGRPWPKSLGDDRGMMDGFDESGSRPGPGPDGYVRRQFSNGGYQGRFKRFPDGGDGDIRSPYSDTNQFSGRMHNQMSGNRRDIGSSPVFGRLHYPQSESRSRSRTPVSWNSRNRSSPPPSGFRADERMMERVRLPFPKRFRTDQEMGYMSPPRNRMSSPRFFEGRNNDGGENQNSFGERKFRPGERVDVGNSMRRPNSDNNNNNDFRPSIRNMRFNGAEENTSGNRFEMAQQQRTRGPEATEDGGDDIGQIRFKEEQSVVVTNNNKES